jgi:hypothetical protein
MGYVNIVNRKGSEKDSDSNFSKESIIDNPILKQKFEDYNAGICKKELEGLRESLMERTHLPCDDHLIKDISATDICKIHILMVQLFRRSHT